MMLKKSNDEEETRKKNTNTGGKSEKNKNKKHFTCFECTYETDKKEKLMQHIVNDHETPRHRKPAEEQHHRRSRVGEPSGNKEQQNKQRETKQYTREERRNNGYCSHWNNGHCSFDDMCRYLSYMSLHIVISKITAEERIPAVDISMQVSIF